MLVARQQKFIQLPKVWINTLIILATVTSVVTVTGCASKPQINSPTRYAKAPDFYTVRSGDTLSGIANRYGLSYLSVAEMNDIAVPYRIYVNQSIRLKKSASQSANRTTTSALNTNESQIQRQTIQLPNTQTTTAQTVIKQNAPVVVATPVQSGSLRWVKPSNGAVLENFNSANNVKGIRFSGNLGDPVLAAADGQVVYAADGLKEYGNLVLIKHRDGYITAYAHNSKFLVKSGQNVTAGQKVAEMGSSGTNRTMLEFQVRLDGKPINPTNILPMN